jgi:hypothetical protein
VLGTKNAVHVRQAHDQPEELLVVQAAIAYQAHRQAREEGMGDANGPLDLRVLTDKVQRVAEPVGIGESGDRQIGHGGGDGWIAAGQPRLPIQRRGRAFVHGRNAWQLLGIRLLEIDRINSHHQRLGPSLRHLLLRDGVQSFQQQARAHPLIA